MLTAVELKAAIGEIIDAAMARAWKEKRI